MQNYVVFHLHSDLSNGVTNIDSVTKYEQYIKYAQSLGMKAIGFSEHGSIFEHIKKRQLCESFGIKYIHGEEFYLTETLSEKLKDNYHIVIMAKNYQGYLELNRLSSIAFNRAKVKTIGDDEHFYYVPRITFDELCNISDNLILSTACLGGVLNRAENNFKEKFIEFLVAHKENCFLEIQHHNNERQIIYNKYLYELSKKYGIRLIAGTDTHCLNERHAKGRVMLQRSKNIYFADEEGWDLTFKTYDELTSAYEKQNSLDRNIYLEAINNTNLIANMVEDYHISNEYKYPHLWDNPVAEFKKRINKGYKERKCKTFPNKQEYIDRIKYETKTYVNNGMTEFMLLATDMIDFCRSNDIEVGYGRGSVNGSVVAWALGITEMDSIKYNLNFERFASPEKVSLADVDTDFPSSKRELVKQYLFNREGLNCCDIITFNTIALRGAIRDIGRAMNIPLAEVNKICDIADNDRNEAARLYPELMDYVDIVEGTIVSIGTHPCGCVVSDLNIAETFGLCTTTTSDYPISQIYMKEIDSLNYVKLDLLCLDTIELINETCKLANIDRLTPDNVDMYDDKVWDSIVEDTTMIFQWESDSAQRYIKQLMSPQTIQSFKNQGYDVNKMMLFTIGNGAIRPAGSSYREELANGIARKTGCKAIDDCMASTFGFCVFQCQIIEFLHKCCGFTMGEADVVRRGFAKKLGTGDFIPIIKNGGYLNGNKNHYIKGFIQTMKDDYGYDEEFSQKAIIEFIQVIEDASSYLFSINHSYPYSFEGYVSGYLRYYYPVEFITTALNIHSGNEEKTNKITEYAKKQNIKILPIKFRHSKDTYSPDKENNAIYKGIASVKFLNAEVAQQMYEMREQEFPTFIDFLKVNPCNSRQTEILIKLDFFSEFGKSQKLLDEYAIYTTYYGKKQFKKEKITLDDETMSKFATSTDKMYKITDSEGLIKELCNRLEDKSIPIKERLTAEAEYLGYIDYINPKATNYGYVPDIDTKYSPRIKIYRLDTGETVTYKLAKKDYNNNPISNHDLLKFTFERRNKSRLVDGKWQKCLEEFEDWIKTYVIK